MPKLSPEPKPDAEPSVAGSSLIKYKGVRKRKWGKWVSEIRLPNSRERIWLGSYDSAEKAARAFDAAQFCLRGRSASFNFPNNPPDIPGGRSLSHSEIQAAAARFANSTDQVHLEDSDRSHSPSISTSISDWTNDYFSLGATNNSRSESCWDDILMTDHTNNNISNNTMEIDNYYPSEYGIFPGFDDLANDFYVPTTTAPLDNEDENFDGFLAQEPFLWSF